MVFLKTIFKNMIRAHLYRQTLITNKLDNRSERYDIILSSSYTLLKLANVDKKQEILKEICLEMFLLFFSVIDFLLECCCSQFY